jgi:thioredoxin 1
MAGFLRSLFGKKDGTGVVDNGGPSPAASAPESDAAPIHVTDDSFDEIVLGAAQPAIVDFWAPWCGPCRMVAPIIEDLAKAYDGRAVIAKINTDEYVRVAGQLGIRGIPTLVLFKDGEEVDRVVGFAPRHVLEQKLDAALG